MAGWLLELSVFGFSLEHPTANEQIIRSAANTSVLALLAKLVVPQLILPHATESGVAGVLRTVAVRNRLIRVMVGHLLLLSSAGESARRRPTVGMMILRGLEECEMPVIVVRQTLCGARDTAQERCAVKPEEGSTLPRCAESDLPARLDSRPQW